MNIYVKINIGDEKQFIERIIYGKENDSTNKLISLKSISSFDDHISKYNTFIEYSGMYINGEEDGKSSMPTANKETRANKQSKILVVYFLEFIKPLHQK